MGWRLPASRWIRGSRGPLSSQADEATPIGFTIGFFLVLVLAIATILWVRDQNRQAGDRAAAAAMENAIQAELTRLRAGGAPPEWSPPTLPWSLMAGIWTHRLVGSLQPSVYRGGHDPATTTARFTWNQRREPGFILAAALLSLRELGLIRVEVSPPGGFTNEWNRVVVERTGLGVAPGEAPPVEAGLMEAFGTFERRRFGKTTTPSVFELIAEFTRGRKGNPFDWVTNLVIEEARRLGLCAPNSTNRRPAYSIPRLAACEEQVAGFVMRWNQLAVEDPEVVQRLVAESTLGVRARATYSG